MNTRRIAPFLAPALACIFSIAPSASAAGINPITPVSTIAPNIAPVQATIYCAKANNELSAAGNKLLEASFISDAYLKAELKLSLVSFERRMVLHPNEIMSTYSILQAASSKYIKENNENGMELCKQLIMELADPTQINQGKHNTCALAALQAHLYTECPSVVCNVIFQTFEGNLIGNNGRLVVISEAMRGPDREARYYRTGGSLRSYPSQLFQIGAANLYWQAQCKDPRGIKVPAGAITYVESDSSPTFAGDTGERLIINWSDDVREYISSAAGLPETNPGFSMKCVRDTYEMLTGRPGDRFLLAHKSRIENKPAQLFASENDLGKKLADMKRNGQLPAVMAVHPDGDFLQTPKLVLRSPAGSTNRAVVRHDTEWHAICITDYNEETGEVSVDNFWGPHADFVNGKHLALHALYQSSFAPKKEQHLAEPTSYPSAYARVH